MKISRIQVYIIFFTAIAFFYIVCSFVPFHSDDLRYQYDLIDHSYLANFSDIIRSTCESYKSINGRIISNFLGMIYTNLLGKGIFNVVNTALFAVLIILLYKICVKKQKDSDVLVFSLVIAGAFLLNQQGVFYWGVGNSNYLVPAILSLVFLLIIDKFRGQKPKMRFYVLWFVISVVLALHHEMFCTALLGGLFAHFVLFKRYRKEINLSVVLLYSGFLIGSLIVTFCPGILRRANSDMGNTMDMIHLIRKVVSFCLYSKLFIVLIILVVVLYCRKRNLLSRIIRENNLYFMLLAFSLLPALMSKIDTPRPLFAVELFSLILIVRILQYDIGNPSILKKGICCFLFLFVLLQSSVAYSTYRGWRSYKNAVTDYYQSDNSFVLYDSHKVDVFTQMFMKDIDNQLHGKFTSDLIRDEKQHMIGKPCLAFIAIPRQEYEEAILSSDSFFVEKNRVGQSRFYTKDEFDYYIMKYNESYSDSINKAQLYALYELPYVHLKLKIHYSMSDIQDRRMCLFCNDVKYGKFVLMNKSIKKPLGLQINSIGFEETGRAIQILKQ